ncbi:MAG: penicillin acylase family protein [Chitinophagaceae bacterium]
MRIVPLLISATVTIGLVYVLNRSWGAVPPMGKFLSPQQGFWQNAEATDHEFGGNLSFAALKGKVSIYFDERLVPHVFAENDEDLYFAQGYLHAKFRLFQMDLQTRAAEGRASEIAGEAAINYDREQRRLGMRYAAENALEEMEKDPVSKSVFDAYTRGVNAYIESLTESELPIEYKLLNFRPEGWSNLRTALLLKMMAKMLSSGTETDFENTHARTVFTNEQFNLIYPQVDDSLRPIVPKGTVFPARGIIPVAPAGVDSAYVNAPGRAVTQRETDRPDPGNGSNNWVLSGSRTASGAPILANDPHLELSLPSIWYEMQLHVPGSNAYGVTLPGSPFIIIGFNDQIAWGVTNAGRDVKDYFEIRFKDDSRREYWYNGQWTPTKLRPELIKVKGGADVMDTVAYTVFGPVQFDGSFKAAEDDTRNLALRWVAHEPSNEGITFYKLNRATSYDEYVSAISNFQCPAQNFVFASKAGDIAIWQQGRFPARWKDQGLYIMPGSDSTYNWQGFIPQAENPHSLNPDRGYLESANQRPVDSTYPYFIPGGYITPRGVAIEKFLSQMSAATVQDIQRLQNNYYNVQAAMIRPVMMKWMDRSGLSELEGQYLNTLEDWNLEATPDSRGQTIFQAWWDSLQVALWRDELNQAKPALAWPDAETTIESLLRDSTAFVYIDNIETPAKETLTELLAISFQKATTFLRELEKEGRLEWSKFRKPTVYHLLKQNLLPFARQDLPVGGNGNIINAMKHSHGPSWRMVAQLSAATEAYGVYPGGQNGNPGSRFYDNFIDTWARGEYYPLWVMKKSDAIDRKVRWTLELSGK